MRKLMYSVAGPDSKIFETASFSAATAANCKILKTYLVPIDERSNKEKERAKRLSTIKRNFKK